MPFNQGPSVVAPFFWRIFHPLYLDALVADLVAQARPYDRIVVMSNGGFEGVHERLLNALTKKEPEQ